MVYYHDPWCSGLSSYYFNLVTTLSDLGHHIFLVVPDSGAPTMAGPCLQIATTRSSDLVTRGGANGVLGRVKGIAHKLLFPYQVLRKIRDLRRSVDLDLVIAPELFAPGLLVALFTGNKLITRIHTPAYIGDLHDERYRFSWLRRLQTLAEKIQVKRSAGLSVASVHLASVIARDWRIPREKVRVIPNSVQVDWVRGLAAKAHREVTGRYLLYVGRIERKKGVHILSRSLNTVLAGRDDITMIFAGRDCGVKEAILQENRRFHDRIVFLDTVEKLRLFGLVRFADLVILPSLWENCSNAGLEAMAVGRPVLGTYRTAFEEIIEDGINGFLVEPGNAGDLGGKILSCLDRPDLERIGRRAYESVLRFDSRTVAAEYVEFYRSTLAAP
jgi:glycosyltransferase involved in cell wall biosynthesis